jgi:hypothetical protein
MVVAVAPTGIVTQNGSLHDARIAHDAGGSSSRVFAFAGESGADAAFAVRRRSRDESENRLRQKCIAIGQLPSVLLRRNEALKIF